MTRDGIDLRPLVLLLAVGTVLLAAGESLRRYDRRLCSFANLTDPHP